MDKAIDTHQQPAGTNTSKRGCTIIGPPCCEAGDGAKLHLWWDYELIAKRALGVRTLDGLWPNSWDAVTNACIGAIAVSRAVFIAGPKLNELLKHPYIEKQLALKRLALYIGKSTPRHGLSTIDLEHMKRSLIAASAALSITTLDTLDEVRAWNPGIER